MKTIEILCGIPCSGKSTYTQSRSSEYSVQSVSRDELREIMYGKKYKFSSFREDFITQTFDRFVNNCLLNVVVECVILDNTHCKEKYIDQIIRKYPDCKIIIKFFDIPLWKAHYRNVMRYLKTGKWIPIQVMKTMYENYNKINKAKYKQYELV